MCFDVEGFEKQNNEMCFKWESLKMGLFLKREISQRKDLQIKILVH